LPVLWTGDDAQTLRLGQGVAAGGALVDVELNSGRLSLHFGILGMVGRIAVKARLSTVQELPKHIDIGHAGWRPDYGGWWLRLQADYDTEAAKASLEKARAKSRPGKEAAEDRADAQ
jgi:hypothetical protein